MGTPKGVSSAKRELLEAINHHLHGPFDAHAVSQVLKLPLGQSTKIIGELARGGWLTRVRRGTYLTTPLGTAAGKQWSADPWVVACNLFAPCYIAGFTACTHWGMTEQIFDSVVVITAKRVRHSRLRLGTTNFLLHHQPVSEHWGTSRIWHDASPITISNPSRTLVDILNTPSLGGGIRNVGDILGSYFSTDTLQNVVELEDFIKRCPNRTVAKRLGYLLEVLSIPNCGAFIEVLRKLISSGLSRLDPDIKTNGTIIKRWNLRVNARISKQERG